MPDETEDRAQLFARLKHAAETLEPAPSVIVVLDPAVCAAHVQVHVPGTEEVTQIYDAGQRVLYALAAFLEELRPAAEQATAHRKAHSS